MRDLNSTTYEKDLMAGKYTISITLPNVSDNDAEEFFLAAAEALLEIAQEFKREGSN